MFGVLLVNGLASVLPFHLYVVSRTLDKVRIFFLASGRCTEAKFWGVIGTKILRVFSLLFTVTSTNGFYAPSPPPTTKVAWNWFVTWYPETSSLRTLKIKPRNLNEIVRSWIRLQYCNKRRRFYFFSGTGCDPGRVVFWTMSDVFRFLLPNPHF